MKVARTTWDLPEKETTSFCAGMLGLDHQPAFGIQIMWNRPSELWRPVVIVYFWRWILQIGWLVD